MKTLQELVGTLHLEVNNDYRYDDWDDGYKAGAFYILDTIQQYIDGVQGGSDASSTD